MTHDEIIEVLKAHQDRKQLQLRHKGTWVDCMSNPELLSVLSDLSKGDTFRVKPEPRRGFVAASVVFESREMAEACMLSNEILEVVEVVQ